MTVEKEFDFKGRKNAPKKVNEIDSSVSSTKIVENSAHTNTAYAMFGWLGPKAADLKGTICLDLISIIFGDGGSSRLYQNLIEKLPEQVFNMIGSENYQFKDGNNFFIQANFKPEKKEEALKLIENELANLIAKPITEAELLKAKKKTKSRFAFAAETVSEIGETIGYYTTVCNNLKLVEDYLKDLDEITLEDLKTSIEKYLNINNAVISILMPEK